MKKKLLLRLCFAAALLFGYSALAQAQEKQYDFTFYNGLDETICIKFHFEDYSETIILESGETSEMFIYWIEKRITQVSIDVYGSSVWKLQDYSNNWTLPVGATRAERWIDIVKNGSGVDIDIDTKIYY